MPGLVEKHPTQKPPRPERGTPPTEDGTKPTACTITPPPALIDELLDRPFRKPFDKLRTCSGQASGCRLWAPQDDRWWGPAEPVEKRCQNKRVEEVFEQNNLLGPQRNQIPKSEPFKKVVQQLEGEFDQAWKRYQAIRK